MEIPTDMLFELMRLQADIADLARKAAEMHYEIFRDMKLIDEEDPDYGADTDCEDCD